MSSMISFIPNLRNRFGIKRKLVIGLGLLAIGIMVFSLSASPNSGSSSGSSSGGGDESSTSIHMLMVYVLPTSVIVVSGMSVAYMSVLRVVSILKKNRREHRLAYKYHLLNWVWSWSCNHCNFSFKSD
jgi:MFS family permease